MRLGRLLIAAVTFQSSLAIADDDFAVYGVGAGSCSKFVDDFEDAPSLIQTIVPPWVDGYVSGMNVASIMARTDARYKMPVNLKDSRRFVAWLYGACLESPESDTWELLVNLLDKNKITAEVLE